MANLNEYLTGIADSLRTKKGTSAKINAQNFSSEIESIESGTVSAKAISQYASYSEFPTEGKEGYLYIDLSTSIAYYWDTDGYKALNNASASDNIEITYNTTNEELKIIKED